MTECKSCKHEKECNYTERYDYKCDAIVDYQTDNEYNSFKDISKLLNKKEERIRELLKYKYLVKALEEVSNAYIEELISDTTDGALSDEEEQLELGKWHSEHGLSWEDGDVE